MKLYGLIGKTLSYSFSKKYFTEKFQKKNLTGHQYLNFELKNIQEIENLIANPALKGFNVTIPYKQAIIQFLHWQSPVVKETGACNCIKIIERKLFGYNTDVVGFEQTITPLLQQQHTNALILGKGGAAKAVEYALRKLQINCRYVSRTGDGSFLYEDLDQRIIEQHKLIVNTTPLGTFPAVDECPLIPYQFITPKHLLFDLIYNPEKTTFLLKGEEKGAAISNGYKMLVAQAEESWRIWNQD